VPTSPVVNRQGFPGSSFRYTPLEHVRTLFISFVQGLFAAAPPGQYHWVSDEDHTEIIIRDENPIHVNKYGQRPCINFTSGPIQFYHVGMDDLIGYDFSLAKKEKGFLVPGTMSINCCSRTDIEAHNLAWVVAEHIWLLRELFLKKGFFELGRGIGVSPPSGPGSVVANDSGDEWYCSTVSVPWQFARKSSFTPLGREVVKSIEASINMNPLRRVESLGWPEAGHERPISEHFCSPPSFAPGASDAQGGTPDPAGLIDRKLPSQPHPLNPAQRVVVRTVRPNRSGLRAVSSGRAPSLPIDAQCEAKSGGNE
jgi:hypothetical protein